MGVGAGKHANIVRREVLKPPSHHISTCAGHEEHDLDLEDSEPDQLPSFEFPISSNDFVAFDTSPPTTSSFTPQVLVDAEPQRARLTPLIDSWAPSSLSAGLATPPPSTPRDVVPPPIVSSRTPAEALEYDSFYDVATRNIGSGSSRSFTPLSSPDIPKSTTPRRASQTARYDTKSTDQPRYERPLSPPPLNRWGAGSLADIARRNKTQPKANRPHGRAGSKNALAVETRYPPLEPKFDDWQTYGGEVPRGGQGGKVIKDDGWGAASVTVTYPDDIGRGQRRFGGW